MPDRNYITLQEAEKYVPFDANYLGLLIRSERLFGVKKKGRWHTTKEALEEYMRTTARVGTAKKKKARSMLVAAGTGAALFLGLIASAIAGTALFDEDEKERSISQEPAWVEAGTAVGETDQVSSGVLSQQ